MGSISSNEHIETIDLSLYLGSIDPKARKAVADDLVAALHRQGGCGLVGHGLKVETLRKAIDLSRQFFDLPLAQKRTVDHPDGILPHRGYSGVAREKILIYTEEELQAMSGELGPMSKKAVDWKVSRDLEGWKTAFSSR